DVLPPGTLARSRYPRLEPVASASIGRAQIRLDPSVQEIKPRPKPGHLQSRTGLRLSPDHATCKLDASPCTSYKNPKGYILSGRAPRFGFGGRVKARRQTGPARPGVGM